uniref:NADH dehydrogenase subunit 6 n=1 Tax=Nymphon unguiculatum-charcoti complex sp. SEM-1997 TaxID=61899 RepID=E0XLH6_9CHEL|nr:NADH dehydrogenase subunit 6 [Nymphon unguiculatum-charcoti complex sp. SEM-1997]
MMTFINCVLMFLFIAFFLAKTPMAKLIFLIFQTILIGSFMGFTQQNYLWSLIILIVLLGGMFVIFLYISSFTPKSHLGLEVNTNNLWLKIMNILLIFTLVPISLLYSQSYFLVESSTLNLSKMYSSYLSSTVLIGSYLFFILLIVVIMIQDNNRPIRSK